MWFFRFGFTSPLIFCVLSFKKRFFPHIYLVKYCCIVNECFSIQCCGFECIVTLSCVLHIYNSKQYVFTVELFNNLLLSTYSMYFKIKI